MFYLIEHLEAENTIEGFNKVKQRLLKQEKEDLEILEGILPDLVEEFNETGGKNYRLPYAPMIIKVVATQESIDRCLDEIKEQKDFIKKIESMEYTEQ